MQQHAVPQNVTQYQFRLVGDMTLKQFLELASGLVLAFLFYSSNLIFIFKWPLIILSVFFGIALAFFPIEDRPLDQWITNFLKAIYAPTRFIWKQTAKIPSLFLFAPHAIVNTVTAVKTIKAPTLARQLPEASDLTAGETSRLSTLNSLFSALPAPSSAPQPLTVNPNASTIIFDRPSVTVRKLKAPSDVTPAPKLPVQVPTTPPTAVPHDETAQPENGKTALTQSSVPPSTIYHKPVSQATPAENVVKAPPRSVRLPAAPTNPNLVVGVATSKDGKLVEGAIVQILDPSGLPARAMKTNSLGQFATATPLGSGTYTIEIDAPHDTFAPQQLVVSGHVIAPFELRATS